MPLPPKNILIPTAAVVVGSLIIAQLPGGLFFICAVAVTLAAVLGGLLFLDLCPLRSNMYCRSHTKSCFEIHWSMDYFTAREKFRRLAKAAGADEVFAKLVCGDDYTMDFAVFKGDPEHVLIHTSGVHGVEGYAGSAIQSKLLTEWRQHNNPTTDGKPRPTVIFVHAVNPYGFAKYRRFNENNVDLNRNHLSDAEWKEVLSRDTNIAGFDDIYRDLGIQRAPVVWDRYTFLIRAALWVKNHGFTACKRAIVTGQYHRPDGPHYGGKGPEPSLTVLFDALRPYMDTAKKAIAIHVHTGLGPEGVDTFMAESAAHAARVASVWPAERTEGPGGSGAKVGYDLMKGIVSIPRAFPKVDVIDVCEEFGTVPGIFVTRSIFLENAGFSHCKDTYVHEVTQKWLRDEFYPQTISFKTKCLSYGLEAYNRGFDYLVKGM